MTKQDPKNIPSFAIWMVGVAIVLVAMFLALKYLQQDLRIKLRVMEIGRQECVYPADVTAEYRRCHLFVRVTSRGNTDVYQITRIYWDGSILALRYRNGELKELAASRLPVSCAGNSNSCCLATEGTTAWEEFNMSIPVRFRWLSVSHIQ